MPIPKQLIKEVESIEELLKQGNTLLNLTIQDLDLRELGVDWAKIKLANTTFLGCEMSEDLEILLKKKGATVYPRIMGLPYNPYRKDLYTWQELMEGYSSENDQSVDLKIYTHFDNNRYTADINEALSQRIHDHAIDDALREIVEFREDGLTKKKCVGVMGGHGVLRTDSSYGKIAFTAKTLGEEGYFILSGGGPGIMEAANLGAYFAGKEDRDLTGALEILKKAPKLEDNNYIERAKEVLKTYPGEGGGLAIPTWYYSHEPSNLFASKIAKYFSNSIREDVLLSTALYGIIYAPGSAGTIQEIFADAAQNHYVTCGFSSPMVFFGKKFWSEDSNIYQILEKLSEGHKYHEMLAIFDEPEDIVKFIKEHPPVKA